MGSLFAFGSGCGKGEERLEVHPVKGVVLFNNEPMKGGGSINFFPMEKGGRAAAGTINEDGTFTLESYRDGDGAGAAAGKYRVVINQTTVQEGEGSTGGEESATESVETVEKKDRIPETYSNAANSPLIQEIQSGENNLEIKLVTNPNTEGDD
jgi:hypothetical protein